MKNVDGVYFFFTPTGDFFLLTFLAHFLAMAFSSMNCDDLALTQNFTHPLGDLATWI